VASGLCSVNRGRLNCQEAAWEHEQIPEESARVGQSWRMLMLEECRLRLSGNLVSEGRSRPHGRRRGGGFAPVLMRAPVALVLADPPPRRMGWLYANVGMCRICGRYRQSI
jgi:hypothetical protein